MRPGWKLDTDRVAGLHVATLQHDPHHACLADETALARRVRAPLSSCPYGRIDLDAGIAQARHLDDRRVANVQAWAPCGSDRRSTPRVVMFSPISPAATSKPAAFNSSCSSNGSWT